jgi:DNA ligase-1
MVEYVKLYKRTAGGKVQTWWIERDEEKYRMCSGQLDGKITRSSWTTAEPKNEGRANETTAVQQAAAEVESAYEKKKKQGYSDQLEEAGERKFHCMLAQDYKDRKASVAEAFEKKLAVASQPKLDGVRCIARATGLLSRKNTPIMCPHIERALAPIFATFPNAVIDGELYNHQLVTEDRSGFEKLVGLVRKSKLSVDQATELAEKVEYHVYDIVLPCDYIDRAPVLQDLIDTDVNKPFIILTPTLWVETQRELDMAYDRYLEEQYEGQMVRLPGTYDQKRSPLLLKRKEGIDEEFVLLDLLPGKGNAAGMAARAVIRLEDGRQNEAGIKAGRDAKIELLKNKSNYIGGQVTVRYQNRTGDGKLRFPRVIKFHPGGRAL